MGYNVSLISFQFCPLVLKFVRGVLSHTEPSQLLVEVFMGRCATLIFRGTVFQLIMFELSPCLFPQPEADHRCNVWWETSGSVWLW